MKEMGKANIYIHGVPCGQSLWGPDEDKDFVKSFYSNNVQDEISSLLKIDILRNKSFYTYIRKANIIDINGRPGSFFAVTLSIEGVIFTSTTLLYEIFRAVFNQLCVHTILEQKGENYQYLINNFEDVSISDKLNIIKEALEQQLTKNADKLKKIPVNAQQEGITKFNIEDVDSPYFFNSLWSSHISISPEYKSFAISLKPLMDECKKLESSLQKKTNDFNILEQQKKQLEETSTKLSRDLNEIKEKLDKQEDELTKAFKIKETELNNKLKHQDSLIEKQKLDINRLTKEKQKIEIDYRKVQTNAEISKSISDIQQPLKILTRHLASRFPENDYLHKQTSQENHKEDNRENNSTSITFIVSMVNCCLIVIMLILFILNFLGVFSTKSTTPELENLRENSIKMEQMVQEYETQNNDLNKTINTLTKVIGEQCKIEVKGISKNTLKKKRSYNISTLPTFSEGIFTTTKNAEIIDNRKIQVRDGDSVTINYLIDGIIVSSRTIKVE